MKLILESPNLEDFLENTAIINYQEASIAKKVQEIRDAIPSLEAQARLAFDFTRDQIRHSFDKCDLLVTVSASEVLAAETGICFAKAHLLAALFRGLAIPTGFCYQRVMRQGTPESGFALHGLNAAYFSSVGWVRLDPRGNRDGVLSTFNLRKEQLAYQLNLSLGERDYPYVYRSPLSSVLHAMDESHDTSELFYRRPEQIDETEVLV